MCRVVFVFVVVVVACVSAYIDDGKCGNDAECRRRTPDYPCCSKFGYCGKGDSYCKKKPTPKPDGKKECEELFPSIQFQNLWRKDLLDLAGNGFAKRFGGKKTKGKLSSRLKVAIIGAGASGLATAYELGKFALATKSSIEITIIEKESRLGGRIKTVGKKGHFLPDIWKDQETVSDAGAMRLPLPPQTEIDCKYNRNSSSICSTRNINCVVGSMSDDELQSLVHGSGDFDFVPDDAFPHFLVRHYIKEFKVPIFRHNMGQAAHDLFGTVFVRGKDDDFRDTRGRNIDQYVLEKVEAVDASFADFLRQNHNGSLADAFQTAVDREVEAWVEKNHVIAETDHSKLKEKLAAWKKFQHDWSATYREHLVSRGWPESVVDIYEVAYMTLTQYRIREDIIETTIGKWWQKEGMFSLRNGMHSLLRKPDPAAAGATAFYDELVKMPKNYNLNVKFLWKTRIERMEKKGDGMVSLLKPAVKGPGLSRVGTFDAVVSTIPAPFVRNVEIFVDGENVAPKEALFETDSLFKMQLQFAEPFWKHKWNNQGQFVVDDKHGFLTSTNVVAKMRYPRSTLEKGNVVMMYVFHENSEAFAHKLSAQGYMRNATAKWDEGGEFDENTGVKEVLEMAIEELQRFHPRIDVRSKFTGNYFVQPWVQLSMPPSGFHQLTKVRKYCDASPKGIYFAGDGFSFKPQWIDGAFYTAYHALFRLINDFSGAGLQDPFKTLDEDVKRF